MAWRTEREQVESGVASMFDVREKSSHGHAFLSVHEHEFGTGVVSSAAAAFFRVDMNPSLEFHEQYRELLSVFCVRQFGKYDDSW
jgi:hypothetical protein